MLPKDCSGLSGTTMIAIFLKLSKLTRGLDFTAQALRHNMSNHSAELSTSFRISYGKTLKGHHSFLVRPIFAAAMSATPYKKDFLAKLANNQADAEQQQDKWVHALERIVKIMKDFQSRKEAKW